MMTFTVTILKLDGRGRSFERRDVQGTEVKHDIYGLEDMRLFAHLATHQAEGNRRCEVPLSAGGCG